MPEDSDFALPAAKRVRREDLYTSHSPSPPEPDVELQAALQRQLATLYGGITVDDSATGQILSLPEGSGVVEDEKAGFEFRLFAAPTAAPEDIANKTETRPMRIVLGEEDDEPSGGGGFVVPNRSPAYFLTGELSQEKRKEFELSAVSGDDVRKWLGVRFIAWEKPWKVSSLKVIGKKAAKGIVDPKTITDQLELIDPAEKRGRTRPGKKRRIILRKKKKNAEEAKQKREREAKDKEDAEREKRTRRNREKKVKRKAKEKAQKGESQGDDHRSKAEVVTKIDETMAQ